MRVRLRMAGTLNVSKRTGSGCMCTVCTDVRWCRTWQLLRRSHRQSFTSPCFAALARSGKLHSRHPQPPWDASSPLCRGSPLLHLVSDAINRQETVSTQERDCQRPVQRGANEAAGVGRVYVTVVDARDAQSALKALTGVVFRATYHCDGAEWGQSGDASAGYDLFLAAWCTTASCLLKFLSRAIIVFMVALVPVSGVWYAFQNYLAILATCHM